TVWLVRKALIALSVMDDETSYFGLVEDHQFRFGVWKGETFFALSNFVADFDVEVYSESGSVSGYMFNVTYNNGKVLGSTYVSSQDSEERSKWTTSLRKGLGFAGLRCNANNTQLGSYLMKKLEISYRNGDIKKKKMVAVVGRQNGTDEIWVMNRQIHLDNKGVQVDPSESPYTWNDELDDMAPELTAVRKNKSSVRALIKAVHKSYGANTPAVLLTIGAEIICFHYDILNDKAYSVPASILTGAVSIGKSTASRIALACAGAQKSFITSATDSKIKSVTSKSTLGIALDDPKDAQDIAEKVMHHFDKGKSCSQTRTCIPRCTFMASVNSEFLKKFSELHPKFVL
uniref:PH domain-containing protein n=1 Tax=Amphimedon queenslandica TaxID=400682 RepID=A0A1X7UJZ4_AMPQE